jgi:hypothetical protein
MFSSFKLAIDELAKNTKQAPGWMPLAAFCYVAFETLVHDQMIAGFALAPHKELLVVAGTLVLYVVGDSLDNLSGSGLDRGVSTKRESSRRPQQVCRRATESTEYPRRLQPQRRNTMDRGFRSRMNPPNSSEVESCPAP